jgi:antitoxin component of RelBE/YafQ-DinJ toxin-antitoxin module
MKETIQICATVHKDLRNQVQEIADRDGRSFSEMVGMLLNQAVKERERQRLKKQAKKL